MYISRSSRVLGRLGRRSLRSNIGLGQAAVNDKVRGIDEAALVAGEEHHRVRLLNSLAKATSGEMHLTTEALRLVITKPVLEKGCAIHSQSTEPPPPGRKRITYFNGAGQSELNLNPSRACTMANSLVIANTAPLLAV